MQNQPLSETLFLGTTHCFCGLMPSRLCHFLTLVVWNPGHPLGFSGELFKFLMLKPHSEPQNGAPGEVSINSTLIFHGCQRHCFHRLSTGCKGRSGSFPTGPCTLHASPSEPLSWAPRVRTGLKYSTQLCPVCQAQAGSRTSDFSRTGSSQLSPDRNMDALRKRLTRCWEFTAQRGQVPGALVTQSCCGRPPPGPGREGFRF